jgi:inorganic phosphate transporter, PiT family
VCVEREERVVVGTSSAAALTGGSAMRVIAGADCPSAVVARVNAMDSLHWLTSGATSFFRGMNDTPKILALGVLAAAATGIATEWFFLLVALAMGLGSYIAGRRVTETLAGRVTTIRHDDGFAANLVTSALVAIASFHALPVSTTHVSTGAITGLGARKADVRWKMVRHMTVAWVVTLPVAGIIAGLAYLAIGRLG